MRLRLLLGDCVARMALMPGGSVDAIVCDPPYEIGFLGMGWDHEEGVATSNTFWFQAFRVLAPGGTVKAFGGTRTFHRTAAAMEEAGFEDIRLEAWAYSSGFPKSLDVSKAIDRSRRDHTEHVAAFLSEAINQSGLTRRHIGERMGINPRQVDQWAPRPNDRSARERSHAPMWSQWVALKGILQFGDELDAEVQRLNERKGQPGDAWFEREVLGVCTNGSGNGTVVGLGSARSMETVFKITASATDEARMWEGWGTALKPAYEPVLVGSKPI